MGYKYYNSKSNSWFFLKLLFVFCIYIFGVLTGNWWSNKYHKVTNALRDEDSVSVAVTDSAIISDSITNTTTTVQISGGPSTSMSINSTNKNTIYVPFIEKNGVKYITIIIGNLKFDAIYDTGCSYPICFTPKAYYKMVGAGIVEEDKFTESSTSTIADGSTTENYHFIIPSIKIGDCEFTNYTVMVSESGDEILVGNALWKDYKTCTIDNKNHRLVFSK